MIGNFITVQQLYEYAVLHNYLKADVHTVLSIINRESSSVGEEHKNLVTPVSSTNTVDFSSLIEYTTEDLLALFST